MSKEVFEILELVFDIHACKCSTSVGTMPNQLSQKLYPKREVDHQIELVLKACPLSMASYSMALLKLEHLRKQLKNLLEVEQI